MTYNVFGGTLNIAQLNSTLFVLIRIRRTQSRTPRLSEEICRQWKGLCLCLNMLLFQWHSDDCQVERWGCETTRDNECH